MVLETIRGFGLRDFLGAPVKRLIKVQAATFDPSELGGVG